MPGRFSLLRAGPRRDRESGQALLELALVVPIIVTLALAIFQFAYVIESQMGLTNAVREAARRTAASTATTPTWTGANSLSEFVEEQLCGDAVSPCTGGLLEENVQGYDGGLLTTDPPEVCFTLYSAASIQNVSVEVSVTYRHPLFFGLLGFATDAVDGTPNNAWDLSASAQMRLENVDPADPLFVSPPVCP
jgi:Flp pilus assembly protein TadG